MTLEHIELLLRRLISGIAHHPIHAIEIDSNGTRSIGFQVHIDRDDMGLVIGKKAAVIRPIQKVFMAIGKASGYTMIGVFVREHGTGRGIKKERKKGWIEDEAIDLATELVEACGIPQIHVAVERKNGCLGVIFGPPPPEALAKELHTVLETYGKSYGKRFGLAVK